MRSIAPDVWANSSSMSITQQNGTNIVTEPLVFRLGAVKAVLTSSRGHQTKLEPGVSGPVCQRLIPK
jgi:hypothetical protein